MYIYIYIYIYIYPYIHIYTYISQRYILNPTVPPLVEAMGKEGSPYVKGPSLCLQNSCIIIYNSYIALCISIYNYLTCKQSINIFNLG